MFLNIFVCTVFIFVYHIIISCKEEIKNEWNSHNEKKKQTLEAKLNWPKRDDKNGKLSKRTRLPCSRKAFFCNFVIFLKKKPRREAEMKPCTVKIQVLLLPYI